MTISTARPTFLLVQGAWHHPDVWLPLRGELFARGYRSVVTDLPSAGSSPVGSMHDDAHAIRQALSRIDGPVVVVAHSYGGIPVTEATVGAANVTQLIYLAAYLPDEDGSMFTLHGIPDPDSVEGLFPAIDDPLNSLYADVAPAQAGFAASMLIEQTTRSFVDRVDGAGWKHIPTAYVITDDDQAIPPAMQAEMAHHARATTYHLTSSHSPFLSALEALATLLERIVSGPLATASVPEVSRPVSTPYGPHTIADEVLAGIDLTGKRIIVTGGASGLGAATVRALATAGAAVTIATRRPEIADDLVAEFANVDARSLDLADLGSVAAFVADWDGTVDAVVANAGVMALPELVITDAGWEAQLATNYLGHFALIEGLHADGRLTRSTRVVMVSSGAQLRGGVDLEDLHFADRPYDPWVAYAQSKSADVLLAVAIARRWGDEGITANALDPGYIHTNLQRHIPADTMRALGAMDDDGRIVTPDYYKTPDEAAATIVLLAASPLVAGVNGAYFENAQEVPVVEGGPEVLSGVASWSVDPAIADELWEVSATATAAVRRP
jgi:NAD(P)-dependent dehydrogenase (short-subunit alcohol dehydrogenase family)